MMKLSGLRITVSFIICGPGRLIAELPAKEAIEVALFADPVTLQTLVGPGSPTGQAIFSTLFSIIRTGTMVWRADDAAISVRLDADDDRRRGARDREHTPHRHKSCRQPRAHPSSFRAGRRYLRNTGMRPVV
jgi:hypothetical protein